MKYYGVTDLYLKMAKYFNISVLSSKYFIMTNL